MMKPAPLSAAICQDQAAACRALIPTTAIAPARVMLAHIAETWERIADRLEQTSP